MFLRVPIIHQRSEIDTLRSQLGSAADEKREILRRLDAVKDATKKSLEASSRRCVFCYSASFSY